MSETINMFKSKIQNIQSTLEPQPQQQLESPPATQSSTQSFLNTININEQLNNPTSRIAVGAAGGGVIGLLYSLVNKTKKLKPVVAAALMTVGATELAVVSAKSINNLINKYKAKPSL